MAETPEQASAAPQPKHLLAAQVDEVLRSAHRDYVEPIVQAIRELESHLALCNVAPLLRSLQEMEYAVAGMDAGALGSGSWLTRWTRRAGRQGALLRQLYDEALATLAPFDRRRDQLSRTHAEHLAGVRSTLARLEGLVDGLDRAEQQAENWLGQIWDELKPLSAAAGSDPGTTDRLRALLGKLDARRVAVKQLATLCTATRDICRIGRRLLDGRVDTLGLLGASFDRARTDCMQNFARMAGVAGQPRMAVPAHDQVAQDRQALLDQLEKVRSLCTRVQIDEQALGQAVAHLDELLPPALRSDA